MDTIRDDMDEFRGQLRNGSIQKAYYALLSYMMGCERISRRYTRAMPCPVSIRDTWT